MRASLKRLLLVLVMFCIPLQGLSAVLMPLCGHDAPAATANTDEAGAGHDHRHGPDAHHHHDGDAGLASLLCDSCGHCQQCLTMGLPAAPAELDAAPPGDVSSLPLGTPTQHFPERFQRPPLA